MARFLAVLLLAFVALAAPATAQTFPPLTGRVVDQAHLLSPAQVAQMLGVAESDVLASLEAGDLKGRKIGTQWRVPKAAVDAFFKS